MIDVKAIRRIVEGLLSNLNTPVPRWMQVDSVDPVRIKAPGESVLPYEPASLVPLTSLTAGMTVLTVWWNGQAVIVGAKGGSVTPPPAIVELGSGVNLDTLTDWKTYTQANNAAAASGSNYPVPIAGLLEVLPIAGGAGAMIWQRYTTYRHTALTGGEEIGPSVYTRAWYNAAWSPWICVGGEPRVAGVVSSKTYYEKYPDGLLICRGAHDWAAASGAQSYTWTFPVAFVGVPHVSIVEDTIVPQNTGVSVESPSLTAVKIWHYRSTAVGNRSWFKAEGRWK